MEQLRIGNRVRVIATPDPFDDVAGERWHALGTVVETLWGAEVRLDKVALMGHYTSLPYEPSELELVE